MHIKKTFMHELLQIVVVKSLRFYQALLHKYGSNDYRLRIWLQQLTTTSRGCYVQIEGVMYK